MITEALLSLAAELEDNDINSNITIILENKNEFDKLSAILAGFLTNTEDEKTKSAFDILFTYKE
jgi:hypothetical protein